MLIFFARKSEETESSTGVIDADTCETRYRHMATGLDTLQLFNLPGYEEIGPRGWGHGPKKAGVTGL